MPTDREIYTFLSGHITENKKQKLESRILYRTRHLTAVLENVYHSQNISAVIRTIECLGIQDLHLLEDKYTYEVNKRVVKGSTKWVDIHRFNTRESLIADLRAKGYLIAATSPGKASIPIQEVPLDQKLAVVFGAEQNGISNSMLRQADIAFTIPMFGFTESYNLSVSAGIALHYIIDKLHQQDQVQWQLSEEEKYQLLVSWAKKMIREPDLLLKRFGMA
jgi:tRNA (guanosine-2'-O-)-methyltransferase